MAGYFSVPQSLTIEITTANINNVDFVVYPQPVLTIDHRGIGQPGSSFTISGEDFPVTQNLRLFINGVDHGTAIRSDSSGGVNFSLNTGDAEPGYYWVTLVANPTQASIWFRLEASGDYWRETPPAITMSDETQPWNIAFLPAIRQRP
jgi:hypothetical protein